MGVIRDLRYAIRGLRANPGFAIAAVLTIAAGVGATAAMFAIVNSVLLRPFPLPGADRVVAVGTSRVDAPSRMGGLSLEELRDWQQQSRTIAAFAAWRDWGMRRYDDLSEKAVYAAIVTPGLFRVFPVRPVLGRLFDAADDTPGRNRLILLAYDYWRSRFGADPAVVGRTMILEREDKAVYTIIGVLPPEFSALASFEDIKLFTLSSTDPDAAIGRRRRNRMVFALLKPDFSIADARAELGVIADRLAREYPATNVDVGAVVQPLIDHEVGPMAETLRTLFMAVGFVLLIACVNVASLQLARALTRKHEFALRAALGGSRRAILRGVVTESLLLAAVGGAAGLLAARWLVTIVLRAGPVIARADAVHFSGVVIGFAALACTAAGLVVSLPASWFIAGTEPADALRGEQGRSGARSAIRARKAFIVAQVAVAVMLLTAAVGAGQTLLHHLTVKPGFEPEGLASIQVFSSAAKYKTGAETTALWREIIGQCRHLPGVKKISAVSALPTSGEGAEPVDFTTGGRVEGVVPRSANSFNVAPGYFQTLGARILRGRDFSDDDRRGTEQVAVVNEAFVNHYLSPGADPLQSHVTLAQDREVLTIVGVVSDVLQEVKPRAVAAPEIYWPYTQRPRGAAFIVVRGDNPGTALSAVRARVLSIDPDLGVGPTRIAIEAISKSARGPRFLLLLFGLFAGVAALLCGIGVYGLVSYTFALRTREIGVRISLGASATRVLRLVASDGFFAVVAGSVLGLGGSVAVARVVASAVAQMEPLSPLTAALAVVIVILIGCLACYVPARRALRLDPVNALRTN